LDTWNLDALTYEWTHGWHGLLLAYAFIALFSLAGLKRGRPGLAEYFFWPFSSMATLVVVGIGFEMLTWLLERFAGLHVSDTGLNIFSLIVCMFGGLLGGLYWARRGVPLGATHSRGAVVFVERRRSWRAGRHVRKRSRDRPRSSP
jgi:hypothetical protein